MAPAEVQGIIGDLMRSLHTRMEAPSALSWLGGDGIRVAVTLHSAKRPAGVAVVQPCPFGERHHERERMDDDIMQRRPPDRLNLAEFLRNVAP